jgi:hypothetical protein
MVKRLVPGNMSAAREFKVKENICALRITVSSYPHQNGGANIGYNLLLQRAKPHSKTRETPKVKF